MPDPARTTAAAAPFPDRLIEAIVRAGAPVCVGLDPVYEKLPEPLVAAASTPLEAVTRFSLAVIDAVADVAGVVKIQSACFERFGPGAFLALRQTTRLAQSRGLIVILDAKRGDIGVSTEHYAAAAFDAVGADAVTVNPYMGLDAVAPFLDPRWGARRSRGVFALVRTSNPAADAVQGAMLHDGRSVAEMIAEWVAAWGKGSVGVSGFSALGAVVAATQPQDAVSLRQRMPEQMFLAPGFGAQGGTVETIRALFNADGQGALVTASRSVLYAFDPGDDDWTQAIRHAATRLADDVRGALAGARR